MKKRILCAILTLIMLVSMVPAAALTASAAGMTASESMITVLKQLEGYSKYCENGYTGYGTLCTLCAKTGAYGDHVTSEKEADAALRAELKELSEAVNSFASKNGLALSQSKHDALVLFSFENGTAWTKGTGDFQNAVKSGVKGSEFLSAICHWDASTADDTRRMIEANMYLNGVYSSSAPSRFIRVEYVAGEKHVIEKSPKSEIPKEELEYMVSERMVTVDGDYVILSDTTYTATMSEAKYQYYDTAENPVANIVPTMQGHTFMGWYSAKEGGSQVTSLTKSRTVYAHWQANVEEPGDVSNVDYIKEVSNAVALYNAPQGKMTDYTVQGNLTIDSEYIDNDNVRWARVIKAQKLYKNGESQGEGMIVDGLWIKLGDVSYNSGSGSATNYTMDVVVTVTNSYLRVRAEDSIYSSELRQVHQGDQLRIVNTSNGSDGILWGQIADADNDGVCEGWIALMYTNYESVRDQGGAVTSYNVIATATVVKPVNGYVNVRSGAGTTNQIVGALPYQTTVDLYEITYVNGIQWGRYSGGWFCLSYADVSGVDLNNYVNDSNVLAYAFTGDLINTWAVYQEPNTSASLVRTKETFDPYNLTITNLTADDEGNTWGKISEGWVMVSDNAGNALDVKLDVAKYYTVVDGVTVRMDHRTSSTRVNNLTKGVEFNVNQTKQVVVVGDTIWGYADKVGEDAKTYSGWINLASKYVSRGDAPAAGSGSSNTEYTGKIATIVGADSVNVRIHGATYAQIIGKIARGTQVPVLDEVDGWYKLDYDVDNNSETDSWVINTYVQVSEGTISTGGSTSGSGTSSNGTGTVETGKGIVANTYSGVNVRTGPGTGNPAVGKILAGTIVDILEVTTHGASKWGRTSQGWVCMDYITMLTYEIMEGLGITDSTGTGSATSSSEVAIYTGVAKNALTIYKTTSLESEAVRTLNVGDPITMHEIVKVVTKGQPVTEGDTTTTTETTSYWARVNDGYIAEPSKNLELDTLDEATYTVTESDTLNVRSNPGTEGTSIEHKLKKGDQVTVTYLEIINGNVWGFVEADAINNVTTDEEGNETVEYWDGDGWISLAYTTKGAITIASNNTANNNSAATTPAAPVIGAGSSTGGYVTNSSGYRYTGKVINTNSVNVRATASTSASITTTLKNGAALVIYETTTSENMAWGRCDAGWVYLYYVDLTPCVSGVVDARVVYNDNTIAYTDTNCTEAAGTYSRMSVIDIYEIVGKMARTELGWVSTDNLL